MPAGAALFTETWPGADGTTCRDVASTSTSSTTTIDTNTNHGRIQTTGGTLLNYLDFGVGFYDTGSNRNIEMAGEFQWGSTQEQYIDIGFRRSTTASSGAGDAPA